MRKLVIIFLLFNLYFAAYNQVIKGTVLDKETRSTISFALIYFNGTFVGTYSDENGNFKIDISKNLSSPLTISAVGYYSFTVNDLSTTRPLTILLTPKVIELNEVVINAKSLLRERNENLKQFKKIFLGTTENAPYCEIKNENDITFNYGLDSDTLRAYATRPIIIDNMALGYKMIYYLDKFEYCWKSKLFHYQGSIIFRDDLTTDDEQKKFFERRRKAAYLGSRMHFFRALWENDLQSTGFEVRNLSHDMLSAKNIVIEEDNHKKFLVYKEKLNICYNRSPTSTTLLLPQSNIVFRKERVYFDKDGYYDPLGIYWEGEMATRSIADWLPYEYSTEAAMPFHMLLQLPDSLVSARQNNCKVKVAEISGAYSGDCKNGLAHGKGIAQGIDRYEGQFRKGMPNGAGTYTWSDGTYYVGQWKEGSREGEGQMIYRDSAVYGMWKNDVFLAKKTIPPYKITRILSNARLSITKVSKADRNIRLRFFRAGVENADMVDNSLSLIYTSGDEYHSGSFVGIQYPRFPIDIKVRFTARNYFHESTFDAIFYVTINEPGTWDLNISY